MSQIALFAGELIAITALILVALIATRFNRKWLFVIIPAALIFAASTYVTITSVMGQPLTRPPAANFIFLDYATDGKTIFIWVVEPGANYPVTLRRPYTKEAHEQLEKGRQGKKKGKVMMGKRGEHFREGEQSKGEFELYEFTATSGNPDKDRQ